MLSTPAQATSGMVAMPSPAAQATLGMSCQAAPAILGTLFQAVLVIMGMPSSQVTSSVPEFSTPSSHMSSSFPRRSGQGGSLGNVVLDNPVFPSPKESLTGEGIGMGGQVLVMAPGATAMAVTGQLLGVFGDLVGFGEVELGIYCLFHCLPVIWILPLGDHLLPATRDKILMGGFMDLFPILYWELMKKDKEEMDDWDKKILKKPKVDRTWANWLLGYLIYAEVLAKWYPGYCVPLLQYFAIV